MAWYIPFIWKDTNCQKFDCADTTSADLLLNFATKSAHSHFAEQKQTDARNTAFETTEMAKQRKGSRNPSGIFDAFCNPGEQEDDNLTEDDIEKAMKLYDILNPAMWIGKLHAIMPLIVHAHCACSLCMQMFAMRMRYGQSRKSLRST